MKRGVLLIFLACATRGAAQDVRYAENRVALGGPRFLMSTKANAPVVDPASVIALQRRVTLTANDSTLGDALRAITEQTGVRFNLSREVVPVSTPVHLDAKELSLAAALTELLLNARIDVAVVSGNELALVRRRAEQMPASGAITGRVTEAKTGQPVPLAQVNVVGTALGRTTSEDGLYTIAGVPAGIQTLTVRRLGYDPKSREVNVADGGNVTADFELVGATSRLAEIVTTVTGAQRRVEMGNAVAVIQADTLMKNAPVMSFGDLLQGRSPGVISMTTSPNAGQSGGIRIRGLNSFGLPNNPIVIIDGARAEASAGQSFGGGSVTDRTTGGITGRLADFDPDEIASVEIVKGPSAATLYGTDAANGVVVITTKRGQEGQRRTTAFIEQGVLDQRLEKFLDAYYAFGHSVPAGTPQRCTLVQRAAGSCVLDSLRSFNTFTNTDTRPFKNGSREQYGLQLSGGAAGGMKYFLSGGYEQEIGTAFLPNSDQAFLRAQRGVNTLPDWQIRPNAFERTNLRGNFTTSLGSVSEVTLASAFVSNQARQPSDVLPFRQVGYRDANAGWVAGGNNERPAYKFARHDEDVVRRFIGSLVANTRPRDWLTMRGTLGADLSTNSFGRLIRRGEDAAGGFFQTGQRIAKELNVSQYSLDLGATAVRSLTPTVGSKSSVGLQYNRRDQRGTQVIATTLPNGGETIAGGTLTPTGPFGSGEGTLVSAVAGAYLEEALSWRYRVYVTGAVRFDGASAFGKNFSIAAYPKASISWVISDPSGGPSLPGFTSLRARAAIGTSGVQPGPFDALRQLQVISGVNGAVAAPGAVIGNPGNVNLRPERTSEVEAGFDADLGAGRVRVELTAYERATHDALVSRPLAPEVGGGARWENLGSVRNRGLEVLMSSELLRNPSLSAGLSITAAFNDNRLLRVAEGVAVSSPSLQLWRQDVGYPLQGVWARTVGSFSDANGNGIIEPTEVVLTENHYVGPGFPPREATAAPYVAVLKDRLRFTGLLQYRGGFYVGTSNSASGGTCVASVASCRAVNDVSAPLADQAQAVARNLGAFGPLIEGGSYFLLRELSASYTVPNSLRLAKAKESYIVLAARNVAMLWREGTAPAPESDTISRDIINLFTAGPPTYVVLRLNLTY